MNRQTRMTWLVARRELRQRAKTRAFAISTVVLLIAVALGVALPAILSRNAKPERIGYVGGSAAATAGIIAEAGRLAGVKTVAVPQPSVAAAEASLGSLTIARIAAAMSGRSMLAVPAKYAFVTSFSITGN